MDEIDAPGYSAMIKHKFFCKTPSVTENTHKC